MTTQELYNKVLKGEVTESKFLYEVRRDTNLPFITSWNTFKDTVKILKNKGIISEEKKGAEVLVKTIDQVNPYEYVPAFDSVFKEFKELRDFIKVLGQKTDDPVVDKLAAEVTKLFNEYRTHIRSKYPDVYKKFQMNEVYDHRIDNPKSSSSKTSLNKLTFII